jgi:hypothetical protein
MFPTNYRMYSMRHYQMPVSMSGLGLGLYVAMSGVTTAASVKVFIEGNEGFTANIVYPEVL